METLEGKVKLKKGRLIWHSNCVIVFEFFKAPYGFHFNGNWKSQLKGLIHCFLKLVQRTNLISKGIEFGPNSGLGALLRMEWVLSPLQLQRASHDGKAVFAMFWIDQISPSLPDSYKETKRSLCPWQFIIMAFWQERTDATRRSCCHGSCWTIWDWWM